MPPTRPSGVLVLNTGHALASGLVCAVAPGPDNTAELVAGGAGTLLTSGSWTGSTSIGAALDSSSFTNGGAFWPWSAGLLGIVQACSIVVFARLDTVSGTSRLFSIPATTGSSTAAALALETNATGTALVLRYANPSAIQRTTTSDTGLPDVGTNTLRQYAVTRSGADVLFWRDGTQHGAAKTITNDNTTFSNTLPPCLLNRSSSSNGNGIDGAAALALVYSRALSGAELSSLWSDPWVLFADEEEGGHPVVGSRIVQGLGGQGRIIRAMRRAA